jgi:hypothetical protein
MVAARMDNDGYNMTMIIGIATDPVSGPRTHQTTAVWSFPVVGSFIRRMQNGRTLLQALHSLGFDWSVLPTMYIF